MQSQKPFEQPIQPVVAGRETVRSEDKIMIVLSYLSILALIPLLTVKDSEFVKWHAKNGLVLTFGGWIAVMVVSIVVPFIGGLIGMLGSLGMLVLAVLSIVKGLEGERWRIPVVSDLAEKL